MWGSRRGRMRLWPGIPCGTGAPATGGGDIPTIAAGGGQAPLMGGGR